MSSQQQYKASSSRTPQRTSTSSSHQQPREMKLLIKPLRKALTPLSSPTPPSPPPNPCPWLWRCHSCYTIYRLAVTRRCLDCDHMFCLGEAGGAPPPKGKKRKRGGPCKAEFDYTGWKARGSWRRTVLLNGGINATDIDAATGHNETNWGDEHTAAIDSRGGGEEEQARFFEDKRERLFLRRRHSCFLHCDFPSECHHSLFRAQQEGRPILRAAEALDAAEEEAAAREAEAERERGKGAKQWARRLTVQEYKQRRAERQGRKSVSAAASLDGALSAVDEEDDDNVSPCSPTSPDPPGDLMREVSPIEMDDDGNSEPISPSGRRPSRASLLVTTDTPADFAATAAPLSFDDDTYSDDEDEYDENTDNHEDDMRRTKSRRKIAQLTGEEPESFGHFILSEPSPTSPSAARPGTNPTALDLQAAWSEQAWFSSSSSAPEQQPPQSPKSPERVSKRDRMFALLGRRGSGTRGPASPTRSSHDAFGMRAPQSAQDSHQRQQQAQHADATAVAGEEWESWSESSSSSSSSTTSEVSLLSSSSAGGSRVAHGTPLDDTDADGDATMYDDEDMDSPVTPEREHGTGVRGDGTDDLRALLRMRNAFMRGEMM